MRFLLCRTRVYSLGMVAIAAIPGRLVGQLSHRLSGAGTLGMAYSPANTTYGGGATGIARLSVGLRLSPTLGVEAEIEKTGDLTERGDDLLLPVPGGPRIPVQYRLYGASLSLVRTPRSQNGEAPIRLLAGAGLYRVTAADEVLGQDTPSVSVLGFHVGIETAIKRWSRGTFFLGFRVVLMPDVNTEQLWLFPLELGFRLR